MGKKKYCDFHEGSAVSLNAVRGGPDATRLYIPITCPYCKVVFVNVPATRLDVSKASKCKDHLLVCQAAKDAGVVVEPPVKRDREAEGEFASPKRTAAASDGEVVIYALVFLPTGQRVYTGRTKDPARRLNCHAARNSKCRLVRNAFRKYGRKNFSLEVILKCQASDADTNESYYIIQNNTLYPKGYNLRHGSMAGEESDTESVIVPACTGVVAFQGFADEANACAEAWQDVADIAGDLEDASNEADEVCKDLLREVHPDKNDQTYSAAEVAAMLNTVRAAL